MTVYTLYLVNSLYALPFILSNLAEVFHQSYFVLVFRLGHSKNPIKWRSVQILHTSEILLLTTVFQKYKPVNQLCCQLHITSRIRQISPPNYISWAKNWPHQLVLTYIFNPIYRPSEEQRPTANNWSGCLYCRSFICGDGEAGLLCASLKGRNAASCCAWGWVSFVQSFTWRPGSLQNQSP